MLRPYPSFDAAPPARQRSKRLQYRAGNADVMRNLAAPALDLTENLLRIPVESDTVVHGCVGSGYSHSGWSERPCGESDSEAPMQCVRLYTRHRGDALNPHLSDILIHSLVAPRIVFRERR